MAANDFDLHEGFDIELPKPEDEYEGKDIPNKQRLYLNASEAQKYIARGHQIYHGPHRGLFIDETEVESQTQRVIPFRFVHEKEAWIKDFIENDPETGQKREYAEQFALKTEGPDVILDEMYHVPNHGPDTILYEDNVERVTGSDEAKEAAKQGIKPKKHWKDHDPTAKKSKASNQTIKTTRNHAVVLNGENTIPAEAQNVHISADRDAAIQAVYWKPSENRTRHIFSKEQFKVTRADHWKALREHFDLDYLPDLINNVTAGADNAAEMDDSHRVIALIALTGFRHGEANDEGKRLPANKEELKGAHKTNTGERTGIGTNALQARDVTLTEVDGDKPASARFYFSGKSDVLHDRTITDVRVVNIIREALKGKESTDRLFPKANEKANTQKIRSFVPEGAKTTKKLKIKDMRSYMGTMAARAEMERYVKEVEDPRDKKAFPTPEQRGEAFERMRDSAGFAAGEVLNHKTRKTIKDEKTGEVLETKWKPKKSEAIKSYIDPKEWEKYKPEDVILKLMNMVKELQTLSKVLPSGGMYVSRYRTDPDAKIYYTEREEGVGVPYWFPESKDEEAWNDMTPEEQEAFMQEDVDARYDKEEEDEKDWDDMTTEEQLESWDDMTSEEQLERFEAMTPEEKEKFYDAKDAREWAAFKRDLEEVEPEDIKEAEEEISEVIGPDAVEIDYDQLAEDERSYLEGAISRFDSRGETYEEELRNPESAEAKERQTFIELLDDKFSWSLPTRDIFGKDIGTWIENNPDVIQAVQDRLYDALSNSRWPDNDGVEMPSHHIELLGNIVINPFKTIHITGLDEVVETGRLMLKMRANDPSSVEGFGKLNDMWGKISDEKFNEVLDTIEANLGTDKTWDNDLYIGNGPDEEDRDIVNALVAVSEMVSLMGQKSKFSNTLGVWEEKDKTLSINDAAKLWAGKPQHEEGGEIFESTEDRTDARNSNFTVVHEVGHAVHHDLTPETNKLIRAEYLRALETNSGFISNYSKGSNEKEFFAECYAAYFTDTNLFRERNPVMADLMEKLFQKKRSTERGLGHRFDDDEYEPLSTSSGTEYFQAENKIKRLQAKGVHLERLQEKRLVAAMLKAVEKTKKKMYSKMGIFSPKAANLSRSTKSTLQKASVPFLKAKGKYKGRTGGITPDWTMKLPGEERDIDEWAEARRKKAEERQWGIKPVGGQPMAKTWIGSLADKGFTYPLIKQVIGSQMWFAQDGIDYIANLGTNEDEVITSVEKAIFTHNKPSISYAPSGRNNQRSKRKSSGKQGERYQGDIIDDEEDDDSNV